MLTPAVALTIVIHFWRLGFSLRLLILAAFEVGFCVYLSLYLNRRSRDLEARFFYVSNGPDRDGAEGLDAAALCVAAAFFLAVIPIPVLPA